MTTVFHERKTRPIERVTLELEPAEWNCLRKMLLRYVMPSDAGPIETHILFEIRNGYDV